MKSNRPLPREANHERIAFSQIYALAVANPRRDIEVTDIDFASSMTKCAPFLIAITVG
jgi:hypothetical protein